MKSLRQHGGGGGLAVGAGNAHGELVVPSISWPMQRRSAPIWGMPSRSASRALAGFSGAMAAE